MRRTTRAALSTLAALTLAAALPASAMAGEITGSGKTTPVKDPGVAASECAFSGLEDEESPLRTQTPHEVYFHGEVVNPAPGSAGFACNPVRSGS